MPKQIRSQRVDRLANKLRLLRDHGVTEFEETPEGGIKVKFGAAVDVGELTKAFAQATEAQNEAPFVVSDDWKRSKQRVPDIDLGEDELS